jgi:hypothetical protein
MRFTSTVQMIGESTTGVCVPADVIASLDAGRHPKVAVTVGHYTFITTVSMWREEFMLPLSAEHRTAAGLAVGDVVDVTVELDEAPSHLELDPDFAAALASDDAARRCFENLSYSKKHWFTVGIAEAHKPEMKARRIETYVAMLREGLTP